ncbi:TetR family transcriptional regulator [Pseudomonas sp. PS02302]|uniref:TetR family transcriptional regulator n=1 Tax=Pseudomonas sp. PS02302 TaxID=2991428 RepID=UPI002499C914|nr:TetR family transcriptional regulator [Pseudomonas sp. PS02302]
MRYKPGHREESRAKILDAVGRGFRKHGYGGIGVDGLAKEAGVTSGAVYTHFPSKAAAFKQAGETGYLYVAKGAVSVKVRGEAPIVYLTGQTFYQPKSAPDTQVVNASKTDAAKVISFRLSNSK